jgi:hypothetical protein
VTPLEAIDHVATVLRELWAGDMVFVGGAVVGLLLTDPAAPSPRYTDDVDVVIGPVSRAAFNQLEARLREAGHTQPTEGDGRHELVDEVREADREAREFVRNGFRRLLDDARFEEAIPAHLMPDRERGCGWARGAPTRSGCRHSTVSMSATGPNPTRPA